MNAKLYKYFGFTHNKRDKLFDNIIRQRHVIQRNGEWFTKFVGTVINFPNRDDYNTWFKADVDLHMKQNGLFSVRFLRYEDMGRSVREFEIRLDEISSVEVWQERYPEVGFNPFIQFDKMKWQRSPP